MRKYYHCSTARYRRRRSTVLTLVGSVAAEAAVISFIVMFFGSLGPESSAGDSFTGTMLLTAFLFIASGLGICFAASVSADKRSSRHSRYTFLDIQLKAAVVSVYSGEMKILGRNAVFRELYLIPFDSFVSARPSPNGRKLVITGMIRHYGMESDFLGYHVRGGNIEFDRMWLNVGSFDELPGAAFPAYFGDPAKICEALAEAKKQFDELPKPKRHEFRPPPKKRPIRRSLPDNPDFSRTWK
ncbi:MAG: hypothetical protein J6O50_16620 [Ruminiclostridium sp.]|nr:hypothetical protein [Ruminiclostridium sp.]